MIRGVIAGFDLEYRADTDSGFRLPAPDSPDRRAKPWRGLRVEYRPRPHGPRAAPRWRRFLLEGAETPADVEAAIRLHFAGR